MKLFLLAHEYERPSGCEEVKVIGIYSSEQLAAAAIEQLMTQPGFRDWPDCFTVAPYEVDRTWWVEGFGIQK